MTPSWCLFCFCASCSHLIPFAHLREWDSWFRHRRLAQRDNAVHLSATPTSFLHTYLGGVFPRAVRRYDTIVMSFLFLRLLLSFDPVRASARMGFVVPPPTSRPARQRSTSFCYAYEFSAHLPRGRIPARRIYKTECFIRIIITKIKRFHYFSVLIPYRLDGFHTTLRVDSIHGYAVIEDKRGCVI